MGVYIAIGLISAATLLLEIAFLRLFAVQQFYHFAFMAVSLALLGAGASGSILSVSRRRWQPPFLCLAFGLAAIVAYLAINLVPFDSFSIAWDARQLIFLGLYFLAASLPFFFAGLLVGEELTFAASGGERRPHRVYGVNLIGSGVGSLGSLFVLSIVGSEGAVVMTAALGFLAALLYLGSERFAHPVRDRVYGPIPVLVTLILLLATMWMLVARPAFLTQRISPYKALAVLLQSLDARHTLQEWDHASRIDVIESSTIHSMPGLSLASPVGPPPQAGLLTDGDNLMPISALPANSPEAGRLAEQVPLGILYHLQPGAHTLVLQAGTGLDVLLALAAGAESVTAVEENQLVIDVMTDEYAGYTYDLYADPRVRIVNQSIRIYARQPHPGGFDAVVLALTAPHRPVTSGAYTLTEDYVYTVEAVEEYLDLLKADGMLMATRWLQTPPSESARLFGIFVQAFANRGLDPIDHLIAFRTLRTMTVLGTLEPLNDHSLATAQRYLEQRGYDAVFYKGLQLEATNRFNILPRSSYYHLFQGILQEPEATYTSHPYDIRPSRDDHPFFHHYFKWRQVPEILASLGMSWQPFGGSGFIVLLVLLVLVSLAAALFIMGPLIVWRTASYETTTGIKRWRERVFFYFACLGLAFLFVEIPLSQSFILMLDEPVTALAIVLFAILVFSGVGSMTVHLWKLRAALPLLVILIAIYPFLLQALAPLVLGLPAWGRFATVILVLAPLGYLMGLPFAAGLRIVETFDHGLVPWSWAINGSFSVISSVLAIIVALTWDFSTVLWLGGLSYFGAFLAFGAKEFSAPS